jgi:hypothetical protein
MALTCPRPESEKDCGLYAQRVAVYDAAGILRRALLRERRQYLGLRQLVRAEAALQADQPPAAPPPSARPLPALPAPAPIAVPVIPINSKQKGSP